MSLMPNGQSDGMMPQDFVGIIALLGSLREQPHATATNVLRSRSAAKARHAWTSSAVR